MPRCTPACPLHAPCCACCAGPAVPTCTAICWSCCSTRSNSRPRRCAFSSSERDLRRGRRENSGSRTGRLVGAGGCWSNQAGAPPPRGRPAASSEGGSLPPPPLQLQAPQHPPLEARAPVLVAAVLEVHRRQPARRVVRLLAGQDLLQGGGALCVYDKGCTGAGPGAGRGTQVTACRPAHHAPRGRSRSRGGPRGRAAPPRPPFAWRGRGSARSAGSRTPPAGLAAPGPPWLLGGAAGRRSGAGVKTGAGAASGGSGVAAAAARRATWRAPAPFKPFFLGPADAGAGAGGRPGAPGCAGWPSGDRRAQLRPERSRP